MLQLLKIKVIGKEFKAYSDKCGFFLDPKFVINYLLYEIFSFH